MVVFIKVSRYGDRFVEMRKEMFQNGNYPGSALFTITNFARPGIEIEIQAVGVIGDRCSAENPCSTEGIAKKKQVLREAGGTPAASLMRFRGGPAMYGSARNRHAGQGIVRSRVMSA